MNILFKNLARAFPAFKGLNTAIKEVDATIISREGIIVLDDKKKMEKVKKAIDKRFEDNVTKENGPILVNLSS